MLSHRAFFYLFENLFIPFVLCLIAVSGLLFVLQLIQLSEVLFSDLSLFIIYIKVFALLLLSYLPMVIPFCLLFSILVGYESLSQSSELIALSSLGYNKISMSAPAAFLSAVSFFLSFYILNSLGPSSNYLSNDLERDLKRRAAVFAVQPGVFVTKVKDYVVYAESKSSTGDLQKILIDYKDSSGKQEDTVVFARSGRLIKDKVGLVGIELFDGEAHSVLKKDLSNLIISFKKYSIDFFLPNAAKAPIAIEEQKTTKLLSFFKNESEQSKNSFLMRKEIFKRFLIPFSTIFFFIIGSILGLRVHTRSSKGSGTYFALGIFFIFWGSIFVSDFLSLSYLSLYFMTIPIVVSISIIGSILFYQRKKEVF